MSTTAKGFNGKPYWDHLIDVSIEMAKKAGEVSPVQVRLHIGLIYIEDISTDFVDVEIKNKEGDFGWLYIDSALLHYRLDGVRYFVRMSQFRDLCESVFTTPTTKDPNKPKTHGSITEDGKALIGHLSFESVHKISFTA